MNQRMNQNSPVTENPEAVVDAVLPQWGPVWLRALAAFAVGIMGDVYDSADGVLCGWRFHWLDPDSP